MDSNAIDIAAPMQEASAHPDAARLLALSDASLRRRGFGKHYAVRTKPPARRTLRVG
jgi:hypothetical protein